MHCSSWLPRSSCSSFTWSYFRLLPLPCIHTTLSSAIDHPEITTLIYDHVKLDQKGLYVTLRAGHVAQGTAGLYVPRPENVWAPHTIFRKPDRPACTNVLAGIWVLATKTPCAKCRAPCAKMGAGRGRTKSSFPDDCGRLVGWA